MPTSVFEHLRAKAWPFQYRGSLQVRNIAGGVPSDPRVAEGWLRSKVEASDNIIREMVSQVMVERGITLEEATAEVDRLKHLNGFKRDSATKGLYIEGRQLKAALKEAASVAVASDKLKGRGWGKTNKGLLSYLAEHVMVAEETLALLTVDTHSPVTEPTGITQRFVHTFRGSGIQYEEYVEDAVIDFNIRCDHPFTEEEWGMIWLTGEQQGLGASRSQGYGRYTLTRWEQVG
jgi:hypothetical protein